MANKFSDLRSRMSPKAQTRAGAKAQAMLAGLTPVADTRNQNASELVAEIFASEEDAFAWMHTCHPMLDGQTPFELAKTPAGADSVKDILLSIKCGVSV